MGNSLCAKDNVPQGITETLGATNESSRPTREREEEEELQPAPQPQIVERDVTKQNEEEAQKKRLEDEASERKRKEEAERIERVAAEEAKEKQKREEQEELERQKAEDEKVHEIRKTERKSELQTMIDAKKKSMKEEAPLGSRRAANRFGAHASFPAFNEASHIPVVALVNATSGGMAGGDILQIARKQPYYQDRFFDIMEVVKGQQRGGMMDLFRIRLNEAKEAAKARNVRMRLVSGGGDGTASFALFLIMKALQADESRADDGLSDTGNGFIWTDEELEMSFPALAQMPLGSANDFGNILGWGQKYPGDKAQCCCRSRSWCADQLSKWVGFVIAEESRVVNFDLWGMMPARGEDSCDFKLAELSGDRGLSPRRKVDGKMQLALKKAGLPVPFFLCLYFSTGFGAYMVARFQINRRRTPVANRLEYVRQAVGIVLERTPPQLKPRAGGVKIDSGDEQYFPPRNQTPDKGKKYREVGFYNINWQAHLAHGADRASCCKRLTCGTRTPAKFDDGLLDLYRMRFTTYMKNPGTTMQTDKRKDITLSYEASEGQGIFFQYDGEARFAFSPTGAKFTMNIRKVLNVPVVLGPYASAKLIGPIDPSRAVKFEFCGDSEQEKQQVRRRVFKMLSGEMSDELLATNEELAAAKFPTYD